MEGLIDVSKANIRLLYSQKAKFYYMDDNICEEIKFRAAWELIKFLKNAKIKAKYPATCQDTCIA